MSGDGAIKVEAACPYCFIFNAQLIQNAKAIFAFDTGAFEKRLYKHILLDEMKIEDFSLEKDTSRPNRIIQKLFCTREAYFNGDVTKIKDPDSLAKRWEFHARAYIDLLVSRGRNEPDDRICSMEVLFDAPVPLKGNLLAVVVPHTLWDSDAGAPWLKQLHDAGVKIAPYPFVPGRHPEHYHDQLESTVRDLYKLWSAL